MISEKSKAAQGMLYNPLDDELYGEHERCKELCHRYNNLSPSQYEERRTLIRKLFGLTGRNFVIEQPLFCDYGYNIEIGENFFMNFNCTILDCAKVSFGDNVLIGPDCGFYTANHPIDVATRNTGLEYALPIRVGNNVWIGGGTRIMPGATIGDNCVIGGGSVVTKSIPAGVVAAGNPCRIIRKLTDAEMAAAHEY